MTKLLTLAAKLAAANLIAVTAAALVAGVFSLTGASDVYANGVGTLTGLVLLVAFMSK